MRSPTEAIDRQARNGLGTYQQQRGCFAPMSNLPDKPENRAVDAAWIKKQNEIFDDYVTGLQDWTKLAKRHKVTRAEAINAVEQVKEYMHSTGVFKDMARTRLHEMNHHYSILIRKVHQAVEDMENDASKVDKIPGAIKVIADIEHKRQEALQKTGMFDDHEMGDLVAESDRKVEAIKKLLKAVVGQFPETRDMIIKGLQSVEDPDRLPDPDDIEGEVI